MIMVGIIVLAGLVVAVIGFALWKILSAEKYLSVKEDHSREQKIYISRKGVNLESGSLGGGTGELFRGSSKEDMATVVMSKELLGGKTGMTGRFTLRLQHMETGRIFQGNFSREIILGRNVSGTQQQPAIVLPFPDVSRVHCRIFTDGRNIYVEDLGSTYGTYVNDMKATRAVLLRNKDVIKIGNERFGVEI